MDVDEIKSALTKPRKVTGMAEGLCLNTGSTLLNLAISGKPNEGIPAGHYVFFVGDSASGKTFLALTCLAEAQLDAQFKNYRIIFDNAEDGALMDFEKFFGSRMAERLEPPDTYDDGEPQYSSKVEDFYFNLEGALEEAEQKGRPFIYVLDSMDALSSVYEGKKFQEARTAAATGKKAKGDYGDGKAKVNSRYIRRARARLRDTGSILIIISQTRDNIDAGLFEPQQTRSGGRALKFYSTIEIWTSIAGRLKKAVHGRDRQIGMVAKLSVKKNRVSGKEWDVKVPFYWSTGIDDVGSMVDFLVEEKQWKKSKDSGKIDGTCDFEGCVGRREQVIQFIEKNDLEDDIRDLTAEVWAVVEAACRVERKRRYR